MTDDKRYKFSWMDLVKIFLVFMGLADAFSFLPSSLDIFDKVLTSAVLFYFWIKLRPMKFLFGYPMQKLNYLIIGTFYLLVIDTFVPFIPALYPYGGIISMTSIIGGSILLILISIFITMRVKFGASSLINCLFGIFDKNKKYLKDFNRNKYVIKKFFIVLIILFGMSQYLFGLVNQWFIVSLDKSLILVALLFAVKDLESSKIKALRTAGSFDDKILSTVTKLFTIPKKIHLGLGFLLIFHYLSDLGAFFITYLFNTAKDPYYFSLLGDKFLETGQVISQHHQTLIQLASSETTSLMAQPNILMTYVMSAIGIILLLLMPIIICFFLSYNINLRELVKKNGFVIALIGAFITIFTFVLYPWVQQKAIKQPNILGVDFITNTISSASFISMDYIVLIFGIFLILGLFLFNSKIARMGATAIFMVSLMFLGIYVWNYFMSSANFYLHPDYGGIIHFIGNYNYIIVFTLAILFLLDVFFYLGTFLLFAYHSLKYFIEYILKDLLNNKLIVGLSFFVIIATMFMLTIINQNNFQNIMQLLFAFLIICLLFSFAFYKVLVGKKEFRDDLILAVIFVVFSYLGVGLLAYYLEVSQGFPDTLLNLITPIIMSGIGILLVKFFKLKTLWREIKLKQSMIAVGIGLLFGGIFYLVNEPIVSVISNHMLEIIIFTFFIALSEEFLFRYIIYRIARKSFSERASQIMQALAFSLLHFLMLKTIINHYAGAMWMMMLYFIAVFLFALILGRFVIPKKVSGRKANIWYAIICHWTTNLVLYGLVLSLAG